MNSRHTRTVARQAAIQEVPSRPLRHRFLAATGTVAVGFAEQAIDSRGAIDHAGAARLRTARFQDLSTL
jgi:hypothetical protein